MNCCPPPSVRRILHERTPFTPCRPRAENRHHSGIKPRLLCRCGERCRCAFPMAISRAFPFRKFPAMPVNSLWARSAARKSPCWRAGPTPMKAAIPPSCGPCLTRSRRRALKRLILTNAAGSLKTSMRPARSCCITDHINYAGMNPLIGEHGDENFVPMTDAYDPALRKALLKAAKAEGIPLQAGRLRLVFRAVIRNPGGNPHGADYRRPRGRHVDGARNHHGAPAWPARWPPFRSSPILAPASRVPRRPTRKPSAKAPRRLSA